MAEKLITISGSSGFLGKNLIHYLSPNRFNLLKRDEASICSSHAVINLAGLAHDLKSVADPSSYYQVNTEYSNRLFDAFLASDAEVFITISSVKAIADTTDEILVEEVSPNPETHYGKSKLMAEYYINSKQIPTGKRVYILRPCMIHGPGNKGNLNLLYQVVKRGFPWPLAAFSNKRSYCSVENICFVIKELIERKDISTGTYHIADDDALDTNQVIQLIGESLNQKVYLIPIPKRFITFIARLGDLLHLPLNSERLSKLTENYQVSNQKLKNALGKELPVQAREGLLATLASFKS
ncbi:NAD-dependent epimerase/dehydratase family protein [Aquirufa sp. TARAVU-A1A]